MIDLTSKSLPNTINVGGKDFSIYTDFRVWIKFEIDFNKNTNGFDVRYLFKNEYPFFCDLKPLLDFSRPKKELPKVFSRISENIIALDYEIDADYIYSAFMHQYGIDLIDVEYLHWHKFIALLNGLKGTKLDEIMGYRFYKRDDRKNVDHYAELREAWSIEKPLSEEEKEELEKFNSSFGGE